MSKPSAKAGMAKLGDHERIVITGLGCVSALGVGVAPFWDGVRNGRSALRSLTRSQAGREICAPAAVIEQFQLHHHVQTPHQALLDPFAQYALVAAQEAIRDAAWDTSGMAMEQVAVILGSTSGGDSSRETESVRLFHAGKKNANPAMVARASHQFAVAIVSMHFGFTGPSFTVNSGCASGTHAIAQAYLMLRHGMASYAITGGCDASVTFSTMAAFQAMGVMAVDTCRPFCRQRSGMALGEGAGVLALETLASARARGARIYAELAGVGMSSDAQDPVNPVAHGSAQAMRAAMRMARLASADIGYVNAHGTGTQSNDAVECAAIHSVFGAHAQDLCVSSTKAVHGHALGAAGGFELIATALALEHGVIPPTANFLEADAACDLDVVPNRPREKPIAAALSNSQSLGGLNAVLALATCK